MPLVAYDGSSDEESSNEVEDMDTTENTTVTKLPVTSVNGGMEPNAKLLVTSNTGKFYRKENSLYDVNNDMDSPEEETISSSDTSSLKLNDVLPKPKKVTGIGEISDSIDGEIGPIPPKKVYGDEDKYLPPPKASSFQNLTTKKIKGVVKISIPSLKDFDENDTIPDAKKIFQPSKKGSGLFAVLPPPKNAGVSLMTLANEMGSKSTNAVSNITSDMSKSKITKEDTPNFAPVKMPRSLVPDSVKQNMLGKRPAPSKLEEIRAKYLKKDANVRIVHSGKGKVSSATGTSKKSDDSDDDEDCDFFSLDSSADVVSDPAMLEKLQLPTPSFEPVATQSHSREEDPNYANYNESQPSTSSAKDDVMKYVTNKKKGEAINFIEVNADDLRPDSTEWLKNITDESAAPARRSKGLGGLVKRKHQITYLAFEAKAREQELQNTWAQNRASRRQTQSKYGF